ncbi:MAG: hypothetical protein HOJ06_15810, partial [Rhodospirillaceae bacterium]|nr:hypothetical protein [Rhodospirillaceae bacterium]
TATFLHVGFPYEPGSLTSAQMNLPYAAAITLTDGEAFVEQYTDAKAHDPGVVALTKRVFVSVADDLDALGGQGRHHVRVRVATKDGQTLTAERKHAKGSDAEPLTRQEVIDKFHRLAGTRIGRTGADHLYDCVMGLEKADALRELMGLLSPQ